MDMEVCRENTHHAANVHTHHSRFFLGLVWLKTVIYLFVLIEFCRTWWTAQLCCMWLQLG